MDWSLKSCIAAYDERRLRDWIEEYLQSPEWMNEGLLRRVRAYSVYWPAPVLVPIGYLSRVAGPGAEFMFPQDAVEWTKKVEEIMKGRPGPEDLPPVIGWRDPDGSINLADGNHRVAALEQMGYANVWALIHDGPLRSEAEIVQRSSTVSVPKAVSGELDEISERFRVFAKDCESSSELYQFLSTRIAEDEDILALAKMCRPGQPEPNMLFGSVHYLLINGPDHPLRRYYPSLTLNFESAEFAYPAFRKFVLDNFEPIIELIQEKLVQTNEVQRSAYLFPAISTVSRYFEGKPLSLIEVGASAGFNLLWDQYAYQYDEDEPVGFLGSSLTLNCAVKGERRPTFRDGFPSISNRVGLDLNPIDLLDKRQVEWLQALIWPEHFERKARLNKAIRIAMVNPVTLIKGDALELLPGVLESIPESEVVVVYHTWVANQMSEVQRHQLLQIIDVCGQSHDIVHINTNIEPHLHATIYRNGERIELPLANVDGHARWIEWLD